MSKAKKKQMDDYAGEVLVFLLDNPDSTRRQIQRHLDKYAKALPTPPAKTPNAYSVILHIRGVLGQRVIVCSGRRYGTYRVALTREDAMSWIKNRKINIRNQIQRTHLAVVNTEGEFGADADLTMVKASLESALLILDASIK